MDDYISRQTAIKHLMKRLIETANNNVGFQCDAGETFQDASERVLFWVNELPSADVQPVRHGHWFDRHYPNFMMIVCSECHEEFSYDAETGVSDYNYCPNCGARMDG